MVVYTITRGYLLEDDNDAEEMEGEEVEPGPLVGDKYEPRRQQ